MSPRNQWSILIAYCYYYYYYYYQDILHKSIRGYMSLRSDIVFVYSILIGQFVSSLSTAFLINMFNSFYYHSLHFAYQSLRLSITSPINHFAYQSFRLSIISPINHFAYQSLRLSIISPINHFAYQSFRLSIISPIYHSALAPNVNNSRIYWLSEGE